MRHVLESKMLQKDEGEVGAYNVNEQGLTRMCKEKKA